MKIDEVRLLPNLAQIDHSVSMVTQVLFEVVVGLCRVRVWLQQRTCTRLVIEQSMHGLVSSRAWIVESNPASLAWFIRVRPNRARV